MKSRTVLVFLFVLCTAVFSLFRQPSPAQAAPSNQWARWFIEVSFANSQPVVNMTVEIGHDTRYGTQVVDISKTYPVTCQENGSLDISEDVALFDGNAYLACDMPVFQELVAKLTDGKLKIGDSCTCKLANGAADFTFGSDSENPFFYTPSLQFSGPTRAGGTAIKYQLYVNGEVAESEEFSNTGQRRYGGGAFVKSGSGYLPEFFVDQTPLGSTPASIAGVIEVPTNEKEFFIGYNPDTGEFLQGKLSYLFVDPGCVGHGGI